METLPQTAPNSPAAPGRDWRRTLHDLASPPAVGDLHLGDSATVNAQFWLDRLPLRITAGWSLLAALLAGGLLWRPLAIEWPMLVLLWLLVDPLWGSIWRLAAGRTENLSLRGRLRTTRFWLPYLRAGSPASQLFGADGPASLPLLYRLALPSVVVGGVVASALGTTALGMTALVVLLGLIGWISVRVLHRAPVLLHALMSVGLPWLLTLHWLGIDGQHERWNLYVALIVLWTAHTWAAERSLLHRQDWLAIGVMAGAALGIGVILMIAQTPLWLAPLAIVWLPTWLAAYQRRSLHHQQVWWLVAMLMSALALGQVT